MALSQPRLKQRAIMPILKSGDPHNVFNYYPITILLYVSTPPCFWNILSPQPHSSWRATRLPAWNYYLQYFFTSHIFQLFRLYSQVNVVYTNHSDAFNWVYHVCLVKTLDLMRICDPFLLAMFLPWWTSSLCLYLCCSLAQFFTHL